jgi:hypothetical protein
MYKKCFALCIVQNFHPCDSVANKDMYAAEPMTEEENCRAAATVTELVYCPTQPAENCISPECDAHLQATLAAGLFVNSTENSTTVSSANSTIPVISDHKQFNTSDDNCTAASSTHHMPEVNVDSSVSQVASTSDGSVASMLSTKQFYRKSSHNNSKVSKAEPRPKRLKQCNRFQDYIY